MVNNVLTSHSDEETQKIGEDFAKNLKLGDIVLLYGDLGFGKTTFTKGIARGLGITTRIISPTFTVVRTHGNIYHIDLYRLENKKQLQEIGLKDLLEEKDTIKIIEWPEKLDSVPIARWEVKFYTDNKNTRTINISKYE